VLEVVEAVVTEVEAVVIAGALAVAAVLLWGF